MHTCANDHHQTSFCSFYNKSKVAYWQQYAAYNYMSFHSATLYRQMNTFFACIKHENGIANVLSSFCILNQEVIMSLQK